MKSSMISAIFKSPEKFIKAQEALETIVQESKKEVIIPKLAKQVEKEESISSKLDSIISDQIERDFPELHHKINRMD